MENNEIKSELMKIAASLIRGDNLPPGCAEDYPKSNSGAKIARMMQGAHDHARNLGVRVRQVYEAIPTGWIDARTPPANDGLVLIWWVRHSGYDGPGVHLGEFNHALGYWRPMGCNGNYSDQITHWMPLPDGPKSRRG